MSHYYYQIQNKKETIFVGVTSDIAQAFEYHSENSEWFNESNSFRWNVVWSEGLAQFKAERLIERLEPVYNDSDVFKLDMRCVDVYHDELNISYNNEETSLVIYKSFKGVFNNDQLQSNSYSIDLILKSKEIMQIKSNT